MKGLRLGVPSQKEHWVPIHHYPVDLVLFVRQGSVVCSVSK